MNLIKNITNKLHIPKWLFWLLVVVLVLRIPSLFEPFHYGDEMIYLTLGNAVRKGLVLYRDIHDNKPPLLYLTAAIAGNIFWFRAILAFWSYFVIVFFWKLVKKLFTSDKIVKAATWTFALLTTLPLLEGNIANAENFMIGFSIIAFYLIFSRKNTPKILFLSGALFSVAALFKIPAAFDFPVVIAFWLLEAKKMDKSTILEMIKKTFFLSLGFIIPLGFSVLWYTFRGALNEYLIAAFGQNIGYLSSFRPSDSQLSFFVRNKPLLIRAAIAFVGYIILFIKRKNLSKPFLFASVWVLAALFAITLSERPYPHYLLQLVPSISVLVGMLIAATNIEQSLAIIPLLLAIATPVYYKFWYYPTFTYYLKFFDFAIGKTNQQQYFSTFNNEVNRNYKISEFIVNSTQPDDKVFVWGDSSAIYAISRRLPPIKYVANYHIYDFSNPDEVYRSLLTNPPKMVVVLPEAPFFPLLNSLLKENYILMSTNFGGAEIWYLANNH